MVNTVIEKLGVCKVAFQCLHGTTAAMFCHIVVQSKNDNKVEHDVEQDAENSNCNHIRTYLVHRYPLYLLIYVAFMVS